MYSMHLPSRACMVQCCTHVHRVTRTPITVIVYLTLTGRELPHTRLHTTKHTRVSHCHTHRPQTATASAYTVRTHAVVLQHCSAGNASSELRQPTGSSATGGGAMGGSATGGSSERRGSATLTGAGARSSGASIYWLSQARRCVHVTLRWCSSCCCRQYLGRGL